MSELHDEFETNLGYMISCLKERKKREGGGKEGREDRAKSENKVLTWRL